MSALRICLVTHKVDFQDGQGRVNYEVVMAALNRGHQVTVLAEVCSESIANHPLGRFVKMRDRPIPTQALKDLYFAQKSARWLRAHRGEFDLVQVNGFVTWEPADVVAVHFVHTAWLKNRYYPFHWSSLSPYAYYQRLLSIFNAHWERKTFRRAAALIAVSSFTAGEVAELGIPQEKIHVVHNGVSTDEFAPGESERVSFGLPEGVPLGLFVGDIRTPRKNLETVLEAMVQLPEMHLVVAGGVEGSPYPTLAEKLNLAGRVHFIGKTKRVAALMRSTDMFVFPSRYEAHPLVLMEALASGLPIVVSGNFGAADYIHEGGIVFGDPDDVAALTRALAELVHSPERRRAMGVAARAEALGRQWSRTAAGYLKVYDNVMEQRADIEPRAGTKPRALKG